MGPSKVNKLGFWKKKLRVIRIRSTDEEQPSVNWSLLKKFWRRIFVIWLSPATCVLGLQVRSSWRYCRSFHYSFPWSAAECFLQDTALVRLPYCLWSSCRSHWLSFSVPCLLSVLLRPEFLPLSPVASRVPFPFLSRQILVGAWHRPIVIVASNHKIIV